MPGTRNTLNCPERRNSNLHRSSGILRRKLCQKHPNGVTQYRTLGLLTGIDGVRNCYDRLGLITL
jgi:hypothetical protein